MGGGRRAEASSVSFSKPFPLSQLHLLALNKAGTTQNDRDHGEHSLCDVPAAWELDGGGTSPLHL